MKIYESVVYAPRLKLIDTFFKVNTIVFFLIKPVNALVYIKFYL